MGDEIKSLRDAMHEVRENGYKEIDAIQASNATAEEKTKQIAEKKTAMDVAEREIKSQIYAKQKE